MKKVLSLAVAAIIASTAGPAFATTGKLTPVMPEPSSIQVTRGTLKLRAWYEAYLYETRHYGRDAMINNCRSTHSDWKCLGYVFAWRPRFEIATVNLRLSSQDRVFRSVAHWRRAQMHVG